MVQLKELTISGYEKVLEVKDKKSNLHAFIAIHDTTLGPSLGGCRIYPYPSREDALQDALRLAKAMTYKSAIAELGLGGGKSVIIADPKKDKTPELFFAFGEAIDSLKGQYIVAEDVGSTPEDMMLINQKTPFVAALSSKKSSGDPSRFTARGVMKGIEACAIMLWNSDDFSEKTIAIQGLGHVGARLASFLFWRGANLIITDVDSTLCQEIAQRFGAEIVDPERIYFCECDIFAPCALGGILNDETIPLMQCKAVAGSANNQLLKSKHGLDLLDKNILYAPDYVINGGGIINAALEFDPSGYDPKRARDKLNQIKENLLNIFQKSFFQKKPTNLIADELAQYKIKNKIGKRKEPINWDIIRS